MKNEQEHVAAHVVEPADSASVATASKVAPTPHTPGPWRFQPTCDTWIETVGDPYGHGRMHVADIRGWGHLTGAGSCARDEDAAVDIQRANAHLIAAAPDLLAACEAAAAWYGLDGDECDNPIRVQLFSAIAKAREGQ